MSHLPDKYCAIRLFATLWTVARQPPLSVGFSRQEYWSGLPCCLPEDLPDPGNEPASLTSPVLAGGFFTTTWEALNNLMHLYQPQKTLTGNLTMNPAMIFPFLSKGGKYIFAFGACK